MTSSDLSRPQLLWIALVTCRSSVCALRAFHQSTLALAPDARGFVNIGGENPWQNERCLKERFIPPQHVSLSHTSPPEPPPSISHHQSTNIHPLKNLHHIRNPQCRLRPRDAPHARRPLSRAPRAPAAPAQETTRLALPCRRRPCLLQGQTCRRQWHIQIDRARRPPAVRRGCRAL